MLVSVYIRKEDEDLWRKLPKKSEAISKMLRDYGTSTGSTKELKIRPPILGGTTVQPPSPVEQDILDSLPRDLPITTANKLKNGNCKKCGSPLTEFGKCLQKGH